MAGSMNHVFRTTPATASRSESPLRRRIIDILKPCNLAIVVCFCGWIVAADAATHARSGELLLAQSARLSQDEAAAKVRAETGGRVLDVQSAVQDGLTVYLVKVLLPDGRVRVVTVSSR
jgi:hypothetical protein